MQGGPLSVTLRYSAQAVSSATSAAAAANLLLQEGGSAAQPLSLLSAFASVSNASGQLDKASGPAVPGVEDCQWRLAAQRQHCRQLSHYTASTSGRASSGSWPPLLGSSSSATASRRGSSANLAARWRAFSSSSAAAAAARRPHSSSPERSFASQPAFAYDEPDYDAAAAVEAAATLQRAQQAVETLKARAQERLAEARAMAASPSPFGEPGAVSDMRRMERTEVADLVKVQKVGKGKRRVGDAVVGVPVAASPLRSFRGGLPCRLACTEDKAPCLGCACLHPQFVMRRPHPHAACPPCLSGRRDGGDRHAGVGAAVALQLGLAPRRDHGGAAPVPAGSADGARRERCQPAAWPTGLPRATRFVTTCGTAVGRPAGRVVGQRCLPAVCHT